jgi:hypothetical protein
MRFTRFLCLVGVGALVAACSINETPELSKLTVTPGEAAPGDTVTGTAEVEDDDGDLNGGKMIIRTMQEGNLTTTTTLPIALSDRASKAGLSLAFQVAKNAIAGEATIELIIEDKAGHKSNAQTATITIKK